MEANNMKEKAYKRLAEIRGGMLMGLLQRARTHVEYNKEKPEEIFQFVEYLSKPEKWDYCGMLNATAKAEMELLEYLLDDERKKIEKYK